AVGSGFEWVNSNIIDPAMRGLSAAVLAGSIGEIRGNMWRELLNGATWEEAWDLAEHVSFGQAVTDVYASGMNEDTLAGWYGAGCDEYGNPLNQAYREMRDGSEIYNLVSGSLDFAKTWFLDPGVILGKAAGVVRAGAKA